MIPVPMCGRDFDSPLAQAIRLQHVHESIERPVGVEQIVTIVNDRAEPRPDNPQVMAAIGFEKVAELLQKAFGSLERHFRRCLVSPWLIATAARHNEHIEEPEGLLDALDELEHEIHMAAAWPDPQSLLPIRKSLPLKDVGIMVRFALLRSRPEFHSRLPSSTNLPIHFRFPMAQSAPVVRMKIWPSDTAGELSV